MTSHIAFLSPHDLLLGLSLCWKPEFFPADVFILDDGRFAVPGDGFADLFAVAKAHRLEVDVVDSPRASRTEPLAGIGLGDAWEYRDPFHWNGDGKRRDMEIAYDPNAARVEYLLAAQTREQAATIFECLTKHVGDGIEAVPVIAEGAEPYQHFWLVHGERPPLDALQLAARAWWGPASPPKNAFVFVEWPWSLRLPPSWLQRIQWQAGNGHVLLSRTSPQRLVIAARGAAGSLPFEGYGDVRPVPIRRAQLSDDEVNPRFPVKITLTADSIQDALAERAKEVDHEISVRKLTLQRLEIERDELEGVSDRGAFTPPEPLLLFATERASDVPLDLRRLLMEWGNQPGDLDALQCARFQSFEIPRGLDLRFEVVHVVTTSAALGVQGRASADPTLGLRLLDYAPRAVSSHFVQLTDWAAHGLRMFVPAGLKMHLHPRLRPGPVTVQKLADAFFGRNGGNSNRDAILLLTPGDPLVVCALDTTAFGSLANAFDWQCRLNVDPPDRRTVHAVTIQATAALAEGLVISLDRAVHAEAEAALTRARTELIAWMDADAARIEDYTTRFERIRTTLHTVRSHWAGLESLVVELQQQLDRIRLELTNSASDRATIAGDADALKTAAQALERDERSLADAIAALEGISSVVRSGRHDL